MNEGEQHIRLVEALVGDRWRKLYITDASFHVSIDTLGRMLPLWIDAIAEQASSDGALLQAEIARMMKFSPRLAAIEQERDAALDLAQQWQERTTHAERKLADRR